MDNLSIGNPEKLTDNSFKININGQDYEYQVSEEKDVDASIDKINRWLDRGEDSYGGLYDYIKRTFKLIGEYEEPLPEPDELDNELNDEIELPSDQTDVETPVENQLDIDISIDDEEVSITLNDWSAKFQVINDVENFTDKLSDYINDEMTLKDRTALIIQLAKELEANDIVDFYNLFNLILDTGVDIVNSFDEAEANELDEPDASSENVSDVEDELNEPGEEIQEESENLTEDDIIKIPNELKDRVKDTYIGGQGEYIIELADGWKTEAGLDYISWPSKAACIDELRSLSNNNLTEDFYDENTGESTKSEDDKWILQDLIKNEDFINDLITLDLSLFEISSKDTDEKIYFVGGINDIGNKFTLSYTSKEPIELIDGFEKLKEMPECLNNIDDLDKVINYISKLLELYYNKKTKDMEGNNE